VYNGRVTVYLDCNATTPIEPEVADLVARLALEEYGNAGSRTHDFGARAKGTADKARTQLASLVDCDREDVLFTSGATEANNLAILGLASHAETIGKRHIVTTSIEHKAVLAPVESLARRGFDVSLVEPEPGGWVDPVAVARAVRSDTILVSVQHVNNETGIEQPIDDIALALDATDVWFHVDAAQGFGKLVSPLKHRRIDMISVSAHKMYGPKGIGALVARRRAGRRAPLSALMYGGGQERGLRPGTLAVPLAGGFGLSADIAHRDWRKRTELCRAFQQRALDVLLSAGAVLHGDQDRRVAHVLNLSFPGVDSEALMVAWKGLIAVSNGSACTSQSYQPSHVLQAMKLPRTAIEGAVRLSWCHMTPEPDWAEVVAAVRRLT
jgi:cysteine desulfurase